MYGDDRLSLQSVLGLGCGAHQYVSANNLKDDGEESGVVVQPTSLCSTQQLAPVISSYQEANNL